MKPRHDTPEQIIHKLPGGRADGRQRKTIPDAAKELGSPSGLIIAAYHVNDPQIILTAEIAVDAPDFKHLEPIFDTTVRQLANVYVHELPQAVIADAGYWHTNQMQVISNGGVEVLI